MAGGGRGLAQPLPKQGQQNRVPSPTYFVAFEDLKEGNYTASGHPVLHQLHSTEVLPGVQKVPPVLQFVPIGSSPGTGHH